MLRTPTTYTYQEINQWKVDVRELPKKIKECEKTIAIAEEEIKKFETKKSEVIIRDVNPQAERTKMIYAKLATVQNPMTIAFNDAQVKQFQAAINSQNNARLELERRAQTVEATIANFEKAERIGILQKENLASFNKIEILRKQKESYISNMQSATAAAQALRIELQSAVKRLSNINPAMLNSNYTSTQSGASTYTSSNSTLQEASTLNQTIQNLNIRIIKFEQNAANYNGQLNAVIKNTETEERNIQTNVATIAKLEAELAFARFIIPQNPAGIPEQIKKDKAALNDLKSKLSSLDKEIKNNTEQKTALENESSRLAVEEGRSQAMLEEFIKSNPDGELQIDLSCDRYTAATVGLLRGFYEDENSLLNKHKATVRSLENNIRLHNSTIETQHQIKSEHERKLRERHANKFLSHYNYSNSDKNSTIKLKGLLNDLNDELTKALTQYTNNHARIDDPMVRARLREYSARTSFIVHDDRLAESPENLQRRLIHLSGYIWSMHENVTDKAFLLVLSNVLEGRAIAKQDALREFESLRNLYPAQLFALTPENLQALEAQEYSQAYKNLETLLNNQPNDLPYYARQLFVTGKGLLNAVNDNNSSYSHSTQILTAAHALILDFKNPQNHQKLANLLRENQHGKRSNAKVIAGWALMLLAAASFATFVTLGFLSLGILSAPVALGMTASAILFGIGLTLCINGRTKGVHKAIMNFQWAADKSNEKYAESPLSSHSYFNPPKVTAPEASAPPLYSK